MITKQQGIKMVERLIGYDRTNPFESRKVVAELFYKRGRTYRYIEVFVESYIRRPTEHYFIDRETGEIEKAS